MNQTLSRFLQCPSCHSGSSNANHLFDVPLLEDNSPVLQCLSCGLVYKELAPTAHGLEKIYSGDYVHFQTNSADITQAEINSAKQKLSRCQKLLKSRCQPQNLRLLDIGCGSGSFVEIAQKLGYLAEGIDPYLPEELQNDYLHRKSPENIPSESYDIAVLLNVAEHLDKPRDMFSQVWRLLKPNGVMLLTCPYGDSLARCIHQADWGHLALNEHLLFWTPRSLTHLLRELGFQGKVSYRIAGSPFPYGRLTSTSVCTEEEEESRREGEEKRGDRGTMTILSPVFSWFPHSRILFNWQVYVWNLARTIQKQETSANFIRSLVHLTHTGDYLEYAIKKS